MVIGLNFTNSFMGFTTNLKVKSSSYPPHNGVGSELVSIEGFEHVPIFHVGHGFPSLAISVQVLTSDPITPMDYAMVCSSDPSIGGMVLVVAIARSVKPLESMEIQVATVDVVKVLTSFIVTGF